MWASLKGYSEGKLLRSIKSLYKESRACVKVEGDLMKEFVEEQGLRWDCPLSPWLFNVFFDRVMREAIYVWWDFKDSCLIQILMFTDNTLMIAQTEEDLL